MLALFAGGFCAAALAFALGLPWLPALPALAAALAGAGFLCRRGWSRRAALLLAGLAAGLLWCRGYDLRALQPRPAWDGRLETLEAEAAGYTRPTDYGTATDAVLTLDGRRYRAVLYGGADLDLSPGDRLTGAMELAAVGREERYPAARGVAFTARLYGEPAVAAAETVPWRYRPAAAARRLESVLLELLPPEEGGYATALLTGRRDGLSENLNGQLRRSGTLHVVAVSGMHVTMLAGALMLLAGNRRRLGALIALPALWLFAAAAGLSASVVRAAVMESFLLLAPVVGRENDPPTALLAALLVLVLPNPLAILDVGLQLSFASVAGMLLFSRRCYDRLARPLRKGRLPRPLATAVRAVLAAVAAALAVLPLTMPLSLLYFGAYSLAAPLSSALIVPLIPAAFGLTAATAVSGLLWLPLGRLLAAPLAWLLWGILALTRWTAALPLASVSAGSGYMAVFLLGVYAAVLTVLLARRPVRWQVPAGCLTGLLSLCLLLTTWEYDRARLSVTMVDVGQGQSVYLESRGASALYDCGGDGDAAAVVHQFLQDTGRFSLDVLVVSHYDTDHAGAVPALLRAVPVGTVLLPPAREGEDAAIRAAAAETGAAVLPVTADTAVALGAAVLHLYAPPAGASGNDGSLAALCSAGDFDVLLTGDMGVAAEEALVRSRGLGAIEVLAAGHHGAAGSTGAALLEALTPEIVLISVGADNRYGHPAPETLARLAETGAAVYRTDQCGNITVRR